MRVEELVPHRRLVEYAVLTSLAVFSIFAIATRWSTTRQKGAAIIGAIKSGARVDLRDSAFSCMWIEPLVSDEFRIGLKTVGEVSIPQHLMEEGSHLMSKIQATGSIYVECGPGAESFFTSWCPQVAVSDVVLKGNHVPPVAIECISQRTSARRVCLQGVVVTGSVVGELSRSRNIKSICFVKCDFESGEPSRFDDLDNIEDMSFIDCRIPDAVIFGVSGMRCLKKVFVNVHCEVNWSLLEGQLKGTDGI